jgi:formylmethanofuran dehydrogenase subunit E
MSLKMSRDLKKLSATKTGTVKIVSAKEKNCQNFCQRLTKAACGCQSFKEEKMSAKNIVSKKPRKTTLDPYYECHKCGEPAMVHEQQVLWCPECWLKKQGKKIIQLDHTGYYP